MLSRGTTDDARGLERRSNPLRIFRKEVMLPTLNRGDAGRNDFTGLFLCGDSNTAVSVPSAIPEAANISSEKSSCAGLSTLNSGAMPAASAFTFGSTETCAMLTDDAPATGVPSEGLWIGDDLTCHFDNLSVKDSNAGSARTEGGATTIFFCSRIFLLICLTELICADGFRRFPVAVCLIQL